MSEISSGYTDEENATCIYLDQAGCFTWTLAVKVKSCFCFFHKHDPEEKENGKEFDDYEIQAAGIAYLPMEYHLPVNLYFATKNSNECQQAQDILQAEQVVILRCQCWDLDDPITLYISGLDELSRLPPEHEQIASALIEKTSPYQYTRRDA